MTTADLHNFFLSKILISDAERQAGDFDALRRRATQEQINRIESPIVKIGLVINLEWTGASTFKLPGSGGIHPC